MEPPTIYLPAEAVEGVEQLLRAFQRLDRGRMPAKLVGLEPGQEVELSRELVVRAFATRHTIPSLGFLVWERRKKLKPEYQHLIGDDRSATCGSRASRSRPRSGSPRSPTWATPRPQGLDVLPGDLPGRDPDPGDDLRRPRRAASSRSTSTATPTSTTSSPAPIGSRTR